MADVNFTDPVLLIRINQLYREGMAADELYDTTRGVWALGPRRYGARYACAVFRGMVLEVYEIHEWHCAGTTAYGTRVIDMQRYARRWEFTGALAPEEVRTRYVGQSVAEYFPQGAANPVTYLNC